MPWLGCNTYQTLNISMSKSDSAKAREHRLAAKLRENLRRRKAPAAPEADESAGGKASGGAPKDGGQKNSGKGLTGQQDFAGLDPSSGLG